MRGGFEWFVAWRYLRERGRRSGYVPLAIGVFLALVATGLFVAAGRVEAPHPAELALGAIDWKQTLLFGGVGALALGVLVGVFGYLHTLQSIFTTISTYGVFLGTAALVIVLSVMNGFESDLRQKIIGQNAHIRVSPPPGEAETLGNWQALLAKIDGTPGVVGVTPFVTSEVVIAASSNYRGVIIKGIDPKTVGDVTNLVRDLEEGSELRALLPRVRPEPVEPAPPGGGSDDDLVVEERPIEDFSDGDEDIDPVVEERPIRDFSRGEPVTPPSQGKIGDLDLGALDPVRVGEPRPAPPKRPDVDTLDGVLVGSELAKDLHLYRDQEVQIVSPLGQDTPAGQVPRVKQFRVAGFFYTGMYEYDTKSIFVTLPALQAFLSLGDGIHGIEVKVADEENTAPVVAELRRRLGDGVVVQDWKELNRNLFTALKLEKIAMFLVLAIIILVASFSIISNLIMMVVEKAKEIAILKSMGVSNRGVMRIFMFEGLFIGLLGTVLGLVTGVGSCLAMGYFGIPLNKDVYYIDRLPVQMDPLAIVAVALAGVAISFLATIYPSYTAARLNVVEGLRYE